MILTYIGKIFQKNHVQKPLAQFLHSFQKKSVQKSVLDNESVTLQKHYDSNVTLSRISGVLLKSSSSALNCWMRV